MRLYPAQLSKVFKIIPLYLKFHMGDVQHVTTLTNILDYNLAKRVDLRCSYHAHTNTNYVR